MRVTVFTGNQPRHIALIESLAEVAREVFAVQECTTAFAGEVSDLHRDSDVMRQYFSRVREAEAALFGQVRPLPAGVRTLALRMGEVSRLTPDSFADALGADHFIVFGASYLRGPLCDFLVRRQAVNLHMGVSPYYRGSSTNFWAMYDGRPELVGATLHRLTPGLDSGPVLRHILPEGDFDAFELGMHAVRCAQEALVEMLRDESLAAHPAEPQDRSLELRYSRGSDFTDAIASEYLSRIPNRQEIASALRRRGQWRFVRGCAPRTACALSE